MIRNRNIVFKTATDNSPAEDKYVNLPKITTSNLATASTAEGGVVYDSTTSSLKLSNSDGYIEPGLIEVTYADDANGDLADQVFFLANRAYQVVAITEIHSVAGDDASAVNLQVTKDTSTNAPGAGTDLLTNNSNAGFDLKGTANTVQTGTLASATATLQLAAGDRLAVDFAGTLTTLAGVVVTVTLRAI